LSITILLNCAQK